MNHNKTIRTKSLLIALGMSLFAANVSAVTLMEMRGKSGDSKLYLDGDQARLDVPGGRGYMVINSAKNKLYFVMTDRKVVLDMSDQLTAENKRQPAAAVPVKMIDSGPGDKIAGYDTVQYNIAVGDIECGGLLASKSALSDSKMVKVFTMLRLMEQKMRGFSAAFQADKDPCEDANSKILSSIESTGLPMRITNQTGTVTSEVISIKDGAKLPDNAFMLPKEYTVMSMADMQRQVQQQMRQHQPQVDKMMKELEKSGKMSSQQLDKLKRFQNQLQK